MKVPAIFGILMLGLSGMLFAQAQTSQSTAVSFTANIAQFIDVSFTTPTQSFNLNPKDNSTAASPVAVENTANSNVNVSLTVNGSNFVSGGNSIAIGNLRMMANSTIPAASKFVDVLTATDKACTSTVFKGDQDCSDLPVSSSVNLWFNLYVPGGTKAGAYSTTINVRADGILS